MTTQEAIYKLENYDELEGKYNEALVRIDEYERERKEIADKTNKALENPGVFTDRKALTEIADMLTVKPTYLDDDFEVGDVIKDLRDGQIGIFIGKCSENEFSCLAYSQRDESFREYVDYKFDCWQKTGKHYPQIAEIFAELRGENDESSKNPE